MNDTFFNWLLLMENLVILQKYAVIEVKHKTVLKKNSSDPDQDFWPSPDPDSMNMDLKHCWKAVGIWRIKIKICQSNWLKSMKCQILLKTVVRLLGVPAEKGWAISSCCSPSPDSRGCSSSSGSGSPTSCSGFPSLEQTNIKLVSLRLSSQRQSINQPLHLCITAYYSHLLQGEPRWSTCYSDSRLGSGQIHWRRCEKTNINYNINVSSGKQWRLQDFYSGGGGGHRAFQT